MTITTEELKRLVEGQYTIHDFTTKELKRLARSVIAAEKLVEACESVFDGVDATGTQEFYVALTEYKETRK